MSDMSSSRLDDVSLRAIADNTQLPPDDYRRVMARELIERRYYESGADARTVAGGSIFQRVELGGFAADISLPDGMKLKSVSVTLDGGGRLTTGTYDRDIAAMIMVPMYREE